MQELFLSAWVPNDQRVSAVHLLVGYCAMKPTYVLRRRLFWEGSRTQTMGGIDPSFINKQPPQRAHQWRSLHEQLIRQAYVLSIVYEVKHSDFGQPEIVGYEAAPAQNGPIQICDALPGSLQWNDLPDPSQGRPTVTSRLALNIEGELNLVANLNSMGYRYRCEAIQQCYLFMRGSVEFCLSRYLQMPETLQERDSLGAPKANERLPPFDGFMPFDLENKWILNARVQVLNGKDPETMEQAFEELAKIKAELEGCFDFQVVDRHAFDTRMKN